MRHRKISMLEERISFVVGSKDVFVKCRYSGDEIQSKLDNATHDSRFENVIRFMMFDYLDDNSSQSIPTMKSTDQSVWSNQKNQSVCYCLHSENIVLIGFIERNRWISLYMDRYADADRLYHSLSKMMESTGTLGSMLHNWNRELVMAKEVSMMRCR